MFFPIKCQGENIIVVYGKLRQKELQYICIVNSLILLDLTNTMGAYSRNVLQLPWLYSKASGTHKFKLYTKHTSRLRHKNVLFRTCVSH